MNKKAISLMEIMVATILLIFIIIGLIGIFISAKRRIQITKGRISGGELGKLFIDPLQGYVQQDNWDSPVNALCWNNAACIGWNGVTNTVTNYCNSLAANAALQNPFCTNMGMAGAANVANRTIDGIEYSAEYRITQPSANIRKVVTRITWQTPA